MVKKGFQVILQPIAEQLKVQKECYPMTIIYLKLKYCGYAFRLFSRVIRDQYSGEEICPRSRLFAQFHASSTKLMKEDILNEIKLANSRIRVIFATTALGMGVDAPNIENNIHITPPANLESYVQEIGRAGRSGNQSNAMIYYNNNDLSSKNIDESMKKYCGEESCLRAGLLGHFGFPLEKQNHCCCNCERNSQDSTCTTDNIVDKFSTPIRNVESIDEDCFMAEILNVVKELELLEEEKIFTEKVDTVTAEKILQSIEFISCEGDMLGMFGIWDEIYSQKLYAVIEKFAPKIS